MSIYSSFMTSVSTSNLLVMERMLRHPNVINSLNASIVLLSDEVLEFIAPSLRYLG